MNAHAQLQLLVRAMTHAEHGAFGAKIERHVSYLGHMAVAIFDWYTADAHVGITDRFHL